MTIHKEGYSTLIVVFVALAIINLTIYLTVDVAIVNITLLIVSLGFYFYIVHFFRDPQQPPVREKDKLIAPASGRVVVIEEVDEPEYFKDTRLQISIFMSPNNVHINYFPFDGIVKYFKYHKGKYLVAWHPKSSTENERATIVIAKEKSGVEVLLRQIAGSVARRIVTYPRAGDKAVQGEQIGFIKFGSRVDIFLPIGTNINVKVGQNVVGSQTIIA